MKTPLSSILILLSVCGCLSLDPFLFKGEKLAGYRFDKYTGKTECTDALDSLPGLGDGDSIRLIMMQSGGETIATVFISRKSHIYTSADTVILYFHGTGPNLDYYWPRIRLLYATGYPVLAIDYRGYGMSTGAPTEDGIYQDGHTALDYLKDSLGDPVVMLYAFSLGSMVGCEQASTDARHVIARLVLESPIGSVQTLVNDGSYLDLPGSYVTTYKGNNTEKIKNIMIPLFWMHGTRDETLNRETNGVPVWNNYNGTEGYYIRADGATHRSVPGTIGYANYISCLRDFFQGRARTNPLLIPK
jgi:pimeloyl-ACP methyl ester carboxylesterase